MSIKQEIGKVVAGLASSFDAELLSKEEEELNDYFVFTWDDKVSLAQNLYQFHDSLKLYGSFCRRWEESHNGSCCVVERVRDKYLMPKIKQFVENLLENQELFKKKNK